MTEVLSLLGAATRGYWHPPRAYTFEQMPANLNNIDFVPLDLLFAREMSYTMPPANAPLIDGMPRNHFMLLKCHLQPKLVKAEKTVYLDLAHLNWPHNVQLPPDQNLGHMRDPHNTSCLFLCKNKHL